MNNMFAEAYFGKPYKTRDGRKALFIRKDEDSFDLETEDSYNPVRPDGSFLYTKEGYESNNDIVSEWQEPINDEELDKLAFIKANEKYYDDCNGDSCESFEYERNIFIEGFKACYRKAKEK